jgi:CMP-N,N'-diacetyllegionaminic acid synthase
MTKAPYVLALIPARAGSKGVPGKNILNVGGQPLITYSIEHAQASSFISRTIVSTDGEDIAQVAREAGAEVPFMRPAAFAQDDSPDIDVFRHALEFLSETEGTLPDIIVHLRPTGPIRRVKIIDQAVEMMIADDNADSLRSVSLATESPFKMWLMDGPYMKPLLTLPDRPDAHSTARQYLPKVYWQNGYLDITRPKTVMQKNSMVGDKLLSLVIDEPKYEIDYPEDVMAVEEALRVWREQGKFPHEISPLVREGERSPA